MFELTAQEWFNGAWRRAHKRELAVRRDGDAYVCSYAAGCFLGVSMPPDLCVEADTVGGASECIDYGYIGVVEMGQSEAERFLCALQSVHDSAFYDAGGCLDGGSNREAFDRRRDVALDQWLPKLRGFAAEHHLTVPEDGA